MTLRQRKKIGLKNVIFLNYVLHHRQVCFCQSTFRFKSPSFLLHLYFFISSSRQIEPHFIILLKSETFCLTIKCSNKTEKVKWIALLKRFWYVDVVTLGFLGPFQNISIHCRWKKKTIHYCAGGLKRSWDIFH